ncbi:ATP-dependent Clp protease proteolytic subunit [Dongia sp.]|uniref:ATP-dependent Clp protease proteolytic subunit n=1 Tax=Dongia sp. TaxID=1977262 RepID=UPI003750C536
MPRGPKYEALVAEGLLSAAPRKDRVLRLIRRSQEDQARVYAERGEHPPAVIALKGQLTEGYEPIIRRKIAEAWKAPKVVLYVDSPGGFAKVGEAIRKDLEDLDRPIEAHGLACVASAAVGIFAAAQVRRARPTTQFTMHQGAAPGDGLDRWTPKALETLAKRMRDREAANLAWFKQHGIKLTDAMLKDFNNGKDVTLCGRVAMMCGLIQDFDRDPTYERELERQKQEWLRYFARRGEEPNIPPPGSIW